MLAYVDIIERENTITIDGYTSNKTERGIIKDVARAIEKYDFVENKDFSILKNGNGTNAFIDYIVTLEMGKELAMLENNPNATSYNKNCGNCFTKYLLSLVSYNAII